MNNLASFMLVATLATAAAVAALPSMNGALPMYPGANLGPGNGQGALLTADVWKIGMSIQIFTNDDESVVDSWYRSRLHGYARVTFARGAHYDGPGGVVKIVRTAGTPGLAKYGKTDIIFLQRRDVVR